MSTVASEQEPLRTSVSVPTAVGDAREGDATKGPASPESPGRAARTNRATLGQQLVGAELITPQQLDQALAEGSQKGLRLGETLVEMGMVQEDTILPFIESHLGVPATRLRDGMIDPIAVRLLPRRIAEQLDAIALFKVRGTLCVAMADPQNLEHLDEIERITGLKVRPVFAFRSSIQRTLPRCYEEGFEVDTVTADLDESAVQLQADAADVDLTNVESMVDGSPIINLVNYLLVQAIRAGASDIHIEPSRKFSIVRFRVDGQMYEALRPRRDMHPALVSRIKVMGKMDIAEHNRPQDGRFQVTVEGREVDFRISTLPTVLGEKIVLRILDKENLTFNLDLLGFPPDMLKQLKQLLAKPYGLLLGDRPDRQRQNDHAVFRARAHQERAQQRGIRGRPGGVPGRAGQPGAGRRIAGVVVQLRAAIDSAAGSGHHHDRRNPRRADGANRGAGRAHRPPGAQHAAHERLCWCDPPPGGYGD